MKIKTFPLHFTEERLNIITGHARLKGESTKDFIQNAIDERVLRMEREQVGK